MVLDYFIVKYVVNPSNVSETFDLITWNENNPDFYVPPHPMLYLLFLKPWKFMTTVLANLVLPKALAHILQIGIIAFSLITQPLSGLAVMPNIIFEILYSVFFFVMKVFDWYSMIELMYEANIFLTKHNVYYWILSHLEFGVLASWPILRPDLFEMHEAYYCMFWSC